MGFRGLPNGSRMRQLPGRGTRQLPVAWQRRLVAAGLTALTVTASACGTVPAGQTASRSPAPGSGQASTSSSAGAAIGYAALLQHGKGYAVSASSVFRTGDDGVNWANVGPHLAAGFTLAAADFGGRGPGVVVALSRRSAAAMIYTGSGAAWIRRTVHSTGGSASASVLSPAHMWVAITAPTSVAQATDSVIYASTDGGRRWIQVTATAPVALLRASDATTLWGDGGPGLQSLYRSVNGGRTWRRVTLRLPQGVAARQALQTPGLPTFFGKTGVLPTGLYEGSTNSLVFYVTRDGGSTWTATKRLTEPGFQDYGQGVSLPWAVIGPQTWVVVVDHAMYFTQDAGRTWLATAIPVSMPGVHVVSFQGLSSGMAIYSSENCTGAKGSPSSCKLDHGVVRLTEFGRAAKDIQPVSNP
jgi:hypothetical protein